jgi:hypothetical protein
MVKWQIGRGKFEVRWDSWGIMCCLPDIEDFEVSVELSHWGVQ